MCLRIRFCIETMDTAYESLSLSLFLALSVAHALLLYGMPLNAKQILMDGNCNDLCVVLFGVHAQVRYVRMPRYGIRLRSMAKSYCSRPIQPLLPSLIRCICVGVCVPAGRGVRHFDMHCIQIQFNLIQSIHFVIQSISSEVRTRDSFRSCRTA